MEDDFICQDPVTGLPADALDCDLDNDGSVDMLASGNRSWLDLTGAGGGASDLSAWIRTGFPGELFIHTWFEAQTGTATSIYDAVYDRVGDIVLLPVFDAWCKGDPADPIACPDPPSHDISPEPVDTIVYGGGASSIYFHVVSFSPLVITCVDSPSAPKPTFPECRARREAIAQNPPDQMWNPIKTFEGYFIEGYVPGLGGRPGTCIDAGAYTIYLLR